MTRLASTIFIENSEKKILAVSRKYDHNDFGLPGGSVEEGETPEQAAIREAKEETGIDIFDLELIFEREDGDFKVFCFIAKYTGEPRAMENAAVEWVTRDKLNSGSFGKYNAQLFAKVDEK